VPEDPGAMVAGLEVDQVQGEGRRSLVGSWSFKVDGRSWGVREISGEIKRGEREGGEKGGRPGGRGRLPAVD